ncbi:MAG: Ig-like domain-containing protein, partial [Lachnospiraceae bacterium]|nr:Ig-like domain-containing protein [Lachnospiraceae bacterium]
LSSDVTVNFVISERVIDIPAADTTQFVYNGFQQTYSIPSNSYYTVSNNKKTNAGTYTVTVSLDNTSSCVWSDGTTANKTYSFVIDKYDVTIVANDLSRDYRTEVASGYSLPYTVYGKKDASGNASVLTGDLRTEFNSKVSVSITSSEYFNIQTPVKYLNDEKTIDTYVISSSAAYKTGVEYKNFRLNFKNGKLTINPKNIANLGANQIRVKLTANNKTIPYSSNYVATGDYFLCDSDAINKEFSFESEDIQSYIIPSVSVTDRITYDNMAVNTDYVITDTISEKKYGTYDMTITGKKNYTGTYTLKWTIKPTVIYPEVTLQNWYYGTQGNEPVVYGNIFKGGETYKYYDSNKNPISGKPSTPGNYYVRATVGATDKNQTTYTEYKMFKILRPIITYTVSNANKVYGEYDPEFKYTYTITLEESSAPAGSVYTEEEIDALLAEANITPYRSDKGENAGVYTIYASYNNNNMIINCNHNGTLTIAQKTLTKDMVSLSQTNYNQPANETKKIQPVVNISDITEAIGTGFDPTKDYTVNGGTAGYEFGVYTILVHGKNNYTGTVELKWAISNLADYEVTYDALPHGFSDANTLSDNVDPTKKYTLKVLSYDGVEKNTGEDVAYSSIEAPVNVGEYVATYIIYRASDDTTFAGSAIVKINPRSIADETVTYTQGDNLTYNGWEQTQLFTLTYAENNLVEGAGKDYTVTGNKATDAGSYTTTITGIGNFTGTRTQDYTMYRKSILDDTITVEIKDEDLLTYNGVLQTQKVTITDTFAPVERALLVEGTDYELSDNTKIDAGDYQYGYTGLGNYKLSGNDIFTIAKKKVTVTANDQEKIYGEADAAYVLFKDIIEEFSYTPSSEIYLRDYVGEETGKLVFDMKRDNVAIDEDAGFYEDYEHVFLAESNMNTNYDFTFVDGDFTINQKDINDIEFEFDGEMNNTNLGTLIYTGRQQTQQIIMTYVTDESTALGTRKYYSDEENSGTNTGIDISVTKNVGTVATNPDPYVMVITGTGNYTGTRREDFQIAKRSIADATIDLGADLIYNGKEQTKKVTGVYVTLADGNKLSVEYDIVAQLKEDGTKVTDEYGNTILTNTSTSPNAGEYQMEFVGKGNFEGTTSKKFTIEQKNIADESVEVTLNATEFIYNSLVPEVKVDVIVDNDIENSTIGENYTATVNPNCDAGTYELIITGNGNYKGSRVAKYTIVPRDISDAVFNFKYDLVYDGTVKTQEIESLEITDEEAGTLYATYKVIYTQSSSAAGNYSITVIGTGNYTGTAYGTYTVDAYDITNDTLYVGLGEQLIYNSLPQKQDIIEVQTSTGMNVTYQVAFDEATGRYTDTNIDAGNYNIILKGVGNYKGTYVVPYTIERLDISKEEAGTTITLDNERLIYNRLAQTKVVKGVTTKSLSGKNKGDVFDLVEGTEYQIVNNSNVATNAGEYTITIEGKGNYKGTSSINFKIDKKDISDGQLTISKNKYYYSAKQNKPGTKVTVMHKGASNKYTLAEAKEYTTTYKNNIEVGKATVTVKGTGNYKGTLTKQFTIEEDFEQDTTWINKGIGGSIDGTTAKVKWGKVKYADGYEVYVVKCGKVSIYSIAPKEIKNPKKTSATITGLKKGIPYKAIVRAYRIVNGEKYYIATSLDMHFADVKDRTYTNASSIKLNKKSVTLKVKKTFKIKARTTKVDTKKSLLTKDHAEKYRYTTSKKSIAKVDKKGNITAVGKGKCTIYVFGQNGVKAKIKVTVK